MKKVLFTFFCSIVFIGLCYTQCLFNDIFPVKHGASKFETITSLSVLKNIIDNKEANKNPTNFDYWHTPDYLKNDSIFISSFSYKYLYNNCFNGNKSDLFLKFADDKLYYVQNKLTFSEEEFEKCLENYNALVTIFKAKFPFWNEFNRINSKTNEQIGLGLTFFPKSKETRDNVKMERLTISYFIVYETKWNSNLTELYRTGNYTYIIEIDYVNLKGTKLTSEGFPVN